MKTLTFLLLFTGSALAQTDSLKLLQTNLAPDSVRAYADIVNNRHKSETKKSIDELIALTSSETNFYKAHYLLGVSYLDDGNFDEAAKAIRRALTIKTNLNIQDATIYNSAGWIVFLDGQREEGEKLLKQALTSNEPSADPDLQVKTLNNLGMVSLQKGNYEASRNYFRTAVTNYNSEFAEGKIRTVEAIEKTITQRQQQLQQQQQMRRQMQQQQSGVGSRFFRR